MKLTTKSGYTVETMVRNILRTYDEATSEQRSDGLRWYSEAHSVALSLARVMDPTASGTPSVEHAAGIIAALSPRIRWSENVARAWNLVKTGSCSGFVRSREQALAILHGAMPLDVLGGPKTRAFAVAIASGGESGEAVIDVWATRVATRGAYDDVARARYSDVALAYAVAARRRGIKVHAMQAITWVVVRGESE